MKRFDVNDLLETATRQTGLQDFGPADFREGLSQFIDSLNTQGVISEQRWQALHERLQRLLTNRLWFARDLAQHPQIAEQNIESPVIIVSLPRTGSTKLHRMLGASGDFQTLAMWQAHQFARIPGLDDGGRSQRISATRAYEKWMYQISPDIITGHPMFTDEAEEDQLLGEFTFRHTYLSGLFNVPGYSQWLMQADMTPTYDYFRSQIQYLQWQSRPKQPKPWLLKTPNHLGSERHLAKIFDKPRFIITHRDPVKCIPSIANPVRSMRKLYSDEDTSLSLGAMLAELFSFMALDHLQWRSAQSPDSVFDLSFREINEDGIGTARKVYEFLGMPLPEGSQQAMQAWQDRNPREQHGQNLYSAEAIGTTDDRIREIFAPYIERYSKFI